MTTKSELTESVLKSKLIEFKEDHPHYLEEELSCFDDAVKLGFELGQKGQSVEPFAYVIDDGFRQQITMIVHEDTRETAKRFGWKIFPLYASESPGE